MAIPDKPITREEMYLDEIARNGGGGLPPVTAEDNGKVLGVEDGEWSPVEAPSGLPDVTASDNGKVLTVENGAWSPKASAGAFVVTFDESARTMDVSIDDVVNAHNAGRGILIRLKPTENGANSTTYIYMSEYSVSSYRVGSIQVSAVGGKSEPDENYEYYEVSNSNGNITITKHRMTQPATITWDLGTNSPSAFDYTNYENITPITVNVVYSDPQSYISESYPTISSNATLYKNIGGMPMFDQCYVDALCIYRDAIGLHMAMLHIDFLNSANTTYTYKTITTT